MLYPFVVENTITADRGLGLHFTEY